MVEAPPQVEVVRGDDPANAVDRSDSPPTAIPLVDLSWVDPKVVEISSTYKTEVFVTKFLAKHPILKAGGHSHYFSVLPCEPIESVCAWGDRIPVPPSSTCTLVFSRTYMSLSPLTNSQWASFRRST